jgi:hypothetical protein
MRLTFLILMHTRPEQAIRLVGPPRPILLVLNTPSQRDLLPVLLGVMITHSQHRASGNSGIGVINVSMPILNFNALRVSYEKCYLDNALWERLSWR